MITLKKLLRMYAVAGWMMALTSCGLNDTRDQSAELASRVRWETGFIPDPNAGSAGAETGTYTPPSGELTGDSNANADPGSGIVNSDPAPNPDSVLPASSPTPLAETASTGTTNPTAASGSASSAELGQIEVSSQDGTVAETGTIAGAGTASDGGTTTGIGGGVLVGADTGTTTGSPILSNETPTSSDTTPATEGASGTVAGSSSAPETVLPDAGSVALSDPVSETGVTEVGGPGGEVAQYPTSTPTPQMTPAPVPCDPEHSLDSPACSSESFKTKLNSICSKKAERDAALFFAQAYHPIMAIEARLPQSDLEKNPRANYSVHHASVGLPHYLWQQNRPAVLLQTIDLRAENLFGPTFKRNVTLDYSKLIGVEASTRKGWSHIWVTVYVCDDTNRDDACSDEEMSSQLTLRSPTFQACHFPSAVPVETYDCR